MDASIVFADPDTLANETFAEAYEKEMAEEGGDNMDSLEDEGFICPDCHFIRHDLRDSCPCQIREFPTGILYLALKEARAWIDGEFYTNGFNVVITDPRAEDAEIVECYYGSYYGPSVYNVGEKVILYMGGPAITNRVSYSTHKQALEAMLEIIDNYERENAEDSHQG